MAKWLIWTLLEASTLLLIANIVVFWISRGVQKTTATATTKKPEKNETSNLSPQNPIEQASVYKGLAHFLDRQIHYAADSMNKTGLESHEINRVKVWGTILKAERAILLNQASDQPTPILNRFLSSLLYALSSPKLQSTNIDELQASLKEMESEFLQTAELLISKEALTQSQNLLNIDLKHRIDWAKQNLKQLELKQIERDRLQAEIDNLTLKIKKLEQAQIDGDDTDLPFNIEVPVAKQLEKEIRSTFLKQISSLSGLSERQEIVIDQLKNEIAKAQKNQNSKNAIEAQKIAITKLERMSVESQSLIMQLEAELQSSNLSIASLKEYINDKDAKLMELEQQLSQSNETAIGNLQSLNANKKEALVSLRDGLNSAIENIPMESLSEQDKDTKALERLLHESETCVTLLAQELQTAEQENQILKEKVSLLSSNKGDTSELSSSLIKQRERNRELVNITTELKAKVLDMRLEKSYQELRVIYNKKSLESDRLQLAFSDLEKKYLGTLNH